MISLRQIQLLFLLLLLSLPMAAQQNKFRVVDFQEDPLDLTAVEHEKRDANGDRYAVIKVSSENPDDELREYLFNFGYLNHITEYHNNKIWLYVQRNAKRVTIAGEFGSAGACLIGHFQDIQGHLHSPVPVEGGRWREDIRERYEFLVRPLVKMAREGLGGSVYTEAIDQFWEGGGFVTFDREIVKFDYDFLRAIHKEILDAARDGAAGR